MHRVLPAFARVSFAAGVSFRTVSNRRVILGDNDLRGVMALAQAANSNSGSAPTPATTANPQPSQSNIRQQLTNNLQQSGFTNIKVVADSFLVKPRINRAIR
jgi:hypothetical protein